LRKDADTFIIYISTFLRIYLGRTKHFEVR
jgi:hypothetical protein